MNSNDTIVYERVQKDDVAALTAVMKRAFDEDTRRHLGREEGGPPGYDNGEFITKWYIESDSDAFKVLRDGKIIAAYNIFHCPDHVNFLGNIFVDPDYQDKGLGIQIWKHIEEQYPDTKKWATETPGFSRRNHNFYINKCGFNLIRIDNPKDLEESSYYMEKVIK